MEVYIKKYELYIFLAILLLGAFLRLYHLDYPLGLHGDEAWTGIEARRILQQGWIGIWSPSAMGQATLPFYWTALIFKLFGIGIFTLRFSFAILHVITLPFFYLIVRKLFNRLTATIAFIFFSTSHIFINFSHIAPTHGLFIPPFLATVYFFLVAIEDHRKLPTLLAGIFLGISFYCYAGLRILPIFLGLVVLLKIFNRGFLRKNFFNLCIIFGIGFLVMLPLEIFAIENSTDFLARMNNISIFSPDGIIHENSVFNHPIRPVEVLLQQSKSTLGMFSFVGDHDSGDNYAKLPVLDLSNSIFFFIGISWLLLTLRKSKNKFHVLFLFLWICFFLVESAITVDAPNFRRTQPSIAACYILVALGIIVVYEWLQKYIPYKASYMLFIAVIASITFIAYEQISIFYTKQATSSEAKNAFYYPLVRLDQDIHKLPMPLYIYFLSSQWSYFYETNRFLLAGIPGDDRSQEFGSITDLKNLFPNQNVVYVLFPEYGNETQTLQRLYPKGNLQIRYDVDKTVLYSLYIISKQSKT